MRKVFRDDALENAFTKRGWVKISLLNESEVDSLIQFYKTREDFQKRPGLHFSLASDNYNFRKEVNDAIAVSLHGKAESLFQHFKMLYGNFIIKEPGVEGNFPLHQDWTYVDEPEFCSVAIWVAMTDNDEQTGCLHVVEESHLWSDTARGPGLSWKFENVNDELKKLLMPVPLKAGEALVWDHRLIHASNPNLASYARLAATAIFIPEEARAFHYVKEFEPQEKICKHEVNADFFLRYTIQNLKELNIPVVEILPVDHQPYSENELQTLINAVAL